jgi:hypothetical protein
MKFWFILPLLILLACNDEKNVTFKILSGELAIIETSDLKCVEISQNILKFKLNEAATETFANYTNSNIGNSLALSICQSRSEPIVIQDKISSGELAYSLKSQAEKDCAKFLEQQIGNCAKLASSHVPTPSIIKTKGHYTWGHEVNTFTPCNDQKTYWVTGSQVLLKNLEEQYKILTKTPYEKTFAVISGTLSPKDTNSDGFDSDYDGLINIDTVESISPSSDTNCQ